MLVRFEALGTSQQREEFARLRENATEFWSLLSNSGLRAAENQLSKFFPEVDVLKVDEPGEFAFVARDRSAVPLAELLVELAPDSRTASVGRKSASHQLSLREVQTHTNVDLQTSRLRAGFSRGHLLEVVVYVPFDVNSDDETLQVAAEIYLENRLGDAFMDKWVANVSTSRIARTRGLMVVSDTVSQAEHYPLEQTLEILQGAVSAVSEELPLSKLSKTFHEDTWIALEIPPLDDSVLGARSFASSIEPEALKSALEGMPFDSSRFTRGGELFVWCAWQAPLDFESRLTLRQEVEAALSQEQGVALAGTGFSKSHDFLDLWLVPERETIQRIGRVLSACTHAVQLGFYDSSLSGEMLEFRAGNDEF